MKKIKITNTIASDLTEGKTYEVIRENSFIEDGVQITSVTILDDGNEEFIIVNNDEANYQFVN